MRPVVDLGCGLILFLFGLFSFWLLFSGVWEILIFGTGDWFVFGEPFFCGLFTPTYPLPGHRLVPESQYILDDNCNLWDGNIFYILIILL